ncbi:M24 family metallopeptidase [Marinobacter psychrophilus]|jgi:Xaa-Pro dipeptidase|uniref:M24 family metallopeptidase n=1 Tax=Marinobacter psychrophilus TaxID=330734 RepID=UPI001B57E166|nr:Xaa-Pro peptidase family protein [Marinobacter psychrophilus]MBQ0763764.1 aminopeptidase P family protein [Marinobacter psychrophilus]MBQ0843590.1 aminopeptidase P family protein [Marinobacter psychrophilus]
MTDTLIAPSRGFETVEFKTRTEALQAHMAEQNIDVVFFTTEPEFRYFSGFRSQFWESPTRPWFLVIPVSGKPIAVVPEIGAAGLRQTWIEDVRSWPSPRPEDDGISLLADTLSSCAKGSGRIGAMMGPETHLRMPAANFALLQEELSQHFWVDVSLIIRGLRSVKSEAETAKIRFACEVTAAGFDFLLEHLQLGMTEREACKAMHLEMLRLGADACPYLISASGQGGYDNIIMGPTDRKLGSGDVLIIDTGANFDGYFSDFDRNYAFGQVDALTVDAYDAVYNSTEAGLRIAAPGRTTGEVWQAMWSVLEKAGALGNDVGRMGHGLGMQLTEWPSNVPNGDVELQAGMILTLEPGMTYAPGKMMVHEDNILITENGCELLHKRAWRNLPIIG